MKWALVLAGISDFARPAEKLSLTQNAALTTTGLIWTRWCLIIKPKNYLCVSPASPPQSFLYLPSVISPIVSRTNQLCFRNNSLAAVNFFLGVVGVVQCTRIGLWHQSQKGLPAKVEAVKEEVKEEVKQVVKS